MSGGGKRDNLTSSMTKNIGCFQATRRKANPAEHHNGIITVSRNLTGCDGGGSRVNRCADEFVTPLLPPCGAGKECASSISSSLQVLRIN